MNLIAITGISGVTLTAGTSYFMILGPTTQGSSTWEEWNWNTQGVNGLDLYAYSGSQHRSANGCDRMSNGTGNLLGASSGQSVTEPSSLSLLASGLAEPSAARGLNSGGVRGFLIRDVAEAALAG